MGREPPMCGAPKPDITLAARRRGARPQPARGSACRQRRDRRRADHLKRERYLERVPTTGGLRLALQPATRNDRRMRFAQVTLSKVGTEDATPLVTDARGRMRYRLPAGEYRLSLASGPHTQFAVHDRRWTIVRLQLT